MTIMNFESDNHMLDIVQIPFSLDSNYDLGSYAQEYNLEPDYKASSIYEITSRISNRNCVILAGGGASSVSIDTAIIKDSKCWIGIGDQLVCLSLPSLAMLWHKTIDGATCFGVFKSPDGEGLLIHGELDITKITFDGDILWSTSGKDIFSEGF